MTGTSGTSGTTRDLKRACWLVPGVKPCGMARNRSTGTAADRALLVAMHARGRLAGEPFREDGTLTEEARPLARRFDDLRRVQLVPSIPAGQDVPDRTVRQYDEVLRLKHAGYSDKEAFISLALSNYDVPENKLREALLDDFRRGVAEIRKMYGPDALPVLEPGEDGIPAVPEELEDATFVLAEQISAGTRGSRAHSGDEIRQRFKDAVTPRQRRYGKLTGDAADETVDERDHTSTTSLAYAVLGGHIYDASVLAEAIPDLFGISANDEMIQNKARIIESLSCALLTIIRECETSPLASLVAEARLLLPLVRFLTTAAGILEKEPAKVEQIALLVAVLRKQLAEGWADKLQL